MILNIALFVGGFYLGAFLMGALRMNKKQFPEPPRNIDPVVIDLWQS